MLRDLSASSGRAARPGKKAKMKPAFPCTTDRDSRLEKFLDRKFRGCMVFLLFSADFLAKAQPKTDKRVAAILFLQGKIDEEYQEYRIAVH